MLCFLAYGGMLKSINQPHSLVTFKSTSTFTQSSVYCLDYISPATNIVTIARKTMTINSTHLAIKKSPTVSLQQKFEDKDSSIYCQARLQLLADQISKSNSQSLISKTKGAGLIP